jgi:hypothetical protein
MRHARTMLALTLALASVALAVANHAVSAGPPGGEAADHRHSAGKTERQLKAVRQATKGYRDIEAARRAGYEPASPCESSSEGGMGFHYVLPRRAEDRHLDIRKPELLLYEKRDGRMRLVAVEYFVADRDQQLGTDDDRPYLFGRGFDGPMEGHAPGMPRHYDLHAWVWKHNPAGVFAQWNPRVRCP